jgi:hypothetical protein
MRVLDALLDLRELQQVGSQHRRVINGEERGADALQIDWSQGGTDEGARDERRRKAVQAQLRTDLSRSLLEHADEQLKSNKKGKRKYDTHFQRAHAQGGFDSLDAFTHSILGEAVLSKEAYDLLGVAGAAQLVAHTIQQRAQELGKKGLDLDKVRPRSRTSPTSRRRPSTIAASRGCSARCGAPRRRYAELAKSERGESCSRPRWPGRWPARRSRRPSAASA